MKKMLIVLVLLCVFCLNAHAEFDNRQADWFMNGDFGEVGKESIFGNVFSFRGAGSAGGTGGRVSSQAGEYAGDMYVANCNEWVSLRTKADTSSGRLAKVPLGAKVNDVYFVTDEFASCTYNGTKGYILTQYLSFSRVQNSGYSMYVANCDEWVSLRSRPDTSSARLAKVPLGAKVSNIYYVSDEFVSCTYNGRRGYILAQYLSFDTVQTQYYGYGTSTVMGLDGRTLARENNTIYLLEYSASSRLKDANRTYPASNLFDGNYDNAWADGVSGEGVGETIYAMWTAGGMRNKAYGIAIRNGYQKSEKIYNKNSRPKDVSIELGGRRFSARLIDSRDGWQSVIFDTPIDFDCEIEMTLTINSVYVGTIYEDTCITEIDLLVEDD